MATVTDKVAGLYLAFFNRAPDKAGYDAWVASATANTDAFANLANGFSQHETFTTLYGSKTTAEFVADIYVNSLGQAGDANGIAGWTSLIDNNITAGMSVNAARADMVNKFVAAALDFDSTDAKWTTGTTAISPAELAAAIVRQNLIKNKIAVSQDFIDKLGVATNVANGVDTSSSSALSADAAYAASIKILSGVTDDTATVTTAKNLLTALSADTIYTVATINQLTTITDDAATVAAATAAASPVTFTLTSDAATVTEGSTSGYTVTASKAVTADTIVTFSVTPGDGTAADQGTSNTNLNDFGAGTFNPVTATIAAGMTTATFSVNATNDSKTELPENYTVTAVVDGTTLTVDTSLLDGVSDTTFTLTTAADSGSDFTGSSGTDNFVGTMTFASDALASTATLTAGDSLTGGTGTDSLSITVTGSAVTDAGETATPTLAGIETVTVSNFDTDGAEGTDAADAANDVVIDLSLADTDLMTVGTTASSNIQADTLFTNVNQITGVVMAGKGDLNVAFGTAAVAGATDEMTLTVNGVGTVSATAPVASVFTTTGIETLNVVGGSSASNLTDGTGAATVNVSGSSNVQIKTNAAMTTLDASTATGVVSADVTNTATTSILSAKGGTGTTDTITIDGASVTVSATTNDLSKISGFETLAMADASDVTLSTDDASISMFDFKTSAVAASNTLTLNTGYTADTTVAVADGDIVTNTANVGLTVTADANLFDDTTTITGGTGTDTITFTASSAGPAKTELDGVSGVETITILAGTTGVEDVDMDIGAVDTVVASGKTLTIDAHALTNAGATLTFVGTTETDGGFVVTGGAGADSLTGGAKDDTLNGGAGDDGTLVGAAGNDTIDGGAGNDTMDGGAGDDTLTGGAGNDTITAGVGNDTIDGGAGNDTFTMEGNLTSADTIDGGEGTDTLSVTAVDATAMTGVTNVENLAVSGGASVSVTSNLNFDKIDLQTSAASETVTFGTGYTSATTVSIEGGDTVTNTSADIELTVDANSDDITGATVTGSDKAGVTNTLNMTNKAGTGAVDMANFTDIDVLNILDYATTAGNDMGVTVTTYGSAGDSLAIDASALDAGEVLTITGESTANLTVTGGADADTIVLGAGNDTIDAGAGNDTIDVGDNLLGYQDTVDGGAGNDTMQLNMTTAVGDVAFQNVSNVEFLTLDTDIATLTLGAYASTAGITKVTAVAGNDNDTINAQAMTTGITMVASTATTGNDTLTGGSGDDTFSFSGTAGLEDGDTINGTSGTDTIELDNTSAAVTAEIDMDDVSNIDSITVKDNDGGNAATAQAIGVTFSAFAATTAESVVLDASAITDANDALTVTNNSASTYLDFTITGGAGNDTIAGGEDGDTLTGGSGADTITGDVGADTLTGGSGADIFAYASTTDLASGTNAGASTHSTSSKTDTIADFASGTDNIKLTLALADATNTLKATDKGDADSLSNGTSLLTADDNGQYFFNTGDSQLVIDLDGNGLIQATDLVINMTGQTGFSSSDLDVFVTGGTGVDTITTGDGNDVIVGGNEGDVIVAGGGNDYIKADSTGENDIDTVTGGAGNDTFVWSDAGEADVYVEAASGGTDTILFSDALSIAGMSFGITTGAAAANASLAQFEQIIVDTDTVATFNSDQVDGLSLKVNALAAGTAGVTVVANDATSSIDLSNFTFTAGSYIGAAGTSVNGIAFDASDSIVITGDNGGANVMTGTTLTDTFNINGGTDVVTGSTGDDNFAIASNIGATDAARIIDLATTEDITIDWSAGGTFADLHIGVGTARSDVDTTGVVSTEVSYATGGAVALGANDNVILFANVANGLDGIAGAINGGTTTSVTESGAAGFDDGDELLAVVHNDTTDFVEVGIITVGGGDGLNGTADTVQHVATIETVGMTSAQVAATIDFLT